MRILVLEDEPSIRHFVDQALSRRGDRVLVAATPGEAWALLLDFPGPLHAALIDMTLPGDATGVRFADGLKEHTPDTRIVFMTGALPLVPEAATALTRGDVLEKPFTIWQLFSALDRFQMSPSGDTS